MIKALFYHTFLICMLALGSCSEEVPENCTSGEMLFTENDGLLIIEGEGLDKVSDSWNFSTATPEFTGTSYIQWNGENHFSEPGNGYLAYSIVINNPGTYRFQWRTRINMGSSASEHNDAWLRFADADNFFAQKGESILYPKGSGKTPNPNGQSKNGWFKIYQNQRDRWSWQAKTSDHDAHDVFVTFNESGNYLMEISGRSSGFAIDRIVLYKTPVSTETATDVNTPVSEDTCVL